MPSDKKSPNFIFYVSKTRISDLVGDMIILYCIVGNFHGVQFSRKANLQNVCGLIFADVSDHAHYTLHNRAYFAGLSFTDSSLSAKTAKIGPHGNFLLYIVS
jgi:hypothetical protein